MPVFNKLISQTPEDFGAALKISGFYLANELEDYPHKISNFQVFIIRKHKISKIVFVVMQH